MQTFKKYYLWKLELRTLQIDLPQSSTDQLTSSITSRHSRHGTKDKVSCEIGYYRHHIDRNGEPLLQENEYTRVLHKADELRDVFEKANAHIHHELRKLTLSLQSDFDEIKRKLLSS